VASSVIVKNPEILSGVPVFAGTRVPFQALMDYLEGSQTLDESTTILLLPERRL
jgi:uncharacterized protein (DUF433 family)